MDYKELFKSKKINTIEDLFNYSNKNIKFGWIDQNNNRHYDINDAEIYSLESPDEILKNNLGICWDLTELYRSFFETMTDYKIETFYLLYEDKKGCPSHSILVYYKNDKVYWFEPLFYAKTFNYVGIHEYKALEELLDDLKEQFIKSALENKFIPQNFNKKNIFIYRYQKPKYHINGFEMRDHINSSELI